MKSFSVQATVFFFIASFCFAQPSGHRPGRFAGGPEGSVPPYIVTHIPSEAGGDTGIAVGVLPPLTPRYAEGAPVVIEVPGGANLGAAEGPSDYAGMGFVEILFAFPGGGRGKGISGGVYDQRGPHCVRALADVIRFATGRLADTQGRKIQDLVPQFPVLTANAGIVGSSHGGNACGRVMAVHGGEFPDLAFYASMESPYGEGNVNIELGGRDQGVNPAYHAETGVLDLSKLAWSNDLTPGPPQRWRNEKRGVGADLKGALYFDLNGDGTFTEADDFLANTFVQDLGQGPKAWYSPRLIREAESRKLFGDTRPAHIPSLSESTEYWQWRDAAGSIAEAVKQCPNAAVIVYANERDHVQVAPDHPHILTQEEGFRAASCKFIRLNPDKSYVERILQNGPIGRKKPVVHFPDNDAGMAWDRTNIRTGLEPEALPIRLYMQAAVAELADRTQAKNWSKNLDAILYAEAPYEAVAPLRGDRRPKDDVPPPATQESKEQPDPERANITFVVNVHDFGRADTSAATLSHLMDIFTKYNVKGDFYLTAPVLEAYAEKHPEIIQRLRDTGMTISYHFRPPHPAYSGYDARLRDLDDAALRAALEDCERYRLDLATGEAQRDRPGGYAYVKEVFGGAPVCVSALSNPRVKSMLLDIYREQGAQMTMEYHESGTDADKPFVWKQGLLVRPSDFSVTRWTVPGEREESFWWSRLDSPRADEFNPTAYLRQRLSEWQHPRKPLITAIIHENDFYVSGGPSWQYIYHRGDRKSHTPPYDLNAPDESEPRPQENQDAIWRAYEELVQYAAAHLNVVTSADIVKMAAGYL